MCDVTADDGPRRVVGVVLATDVSGGVRALLLNRSDGEIYELPGGELLPGERPVPGICRLLTEQRPADPGAVRRLTWQQLDRCVIASRDAVGFGVAFVFTARAPISESHGLASDGDGLFWAPLSRVRHWAPLCPDAALPLLIAATTLRHCHTGVEAIPEAYFFGPERDRRVATGVLSDG